MWFGCYPNASEKRADGKWDLTASTNKQIVECTLNWMKAGAVLVGGCCGTTPRTIGKIESKRDLFYLNMEHIDLGDDEDFEGGSDSLPF